MGSGGEESQSQSINSLKITASRPWYCSSSRIFTRWNGVPREHIQLGSRDGANRVKAMRTDNRLLSPYKTCAFKLIRCIINRSVRIAGGLGGWGLGGVEPPTSPCRPPTSGQNSTPGGQ